MEDRPGRKHNPWVSMVTQGLYKFSILHTGAGCHHERLARFFSDILAASDREFRAPKTQDDFLTLYHFALDPVRITLEAPTGGHECNGPNTSAAKWHLQDAEHLKSCRELQDHGIPTQVESPGQLLFLKGYPSPEWLGLTGAKYRVDPEYFSRFLDFRSVDDRSNSTSVPFLPSCEWNIIDLPLMSIGLRRSLSHEGQQASLETIRSKSAAALAESHRLMMVGSKIPVGSTIVRDISVLDEANFAIEQKVSICLQPAENDRGWVVLVWADNGRKSGLDFMEESMTSALGLSQPLQTSLLPIINYKPMMGLRAHHLAGNPSDHRLHGSSYGPALHLSYGRSLRANITIKDPFYSLTEVFALVGSSEKQFLNLMELKVEKTILSRSKKPHVNLGNLRYFSALLYKHARYMKSTASSLSKTSHTKWSHSEEETAKRARKEIEQDFLHLHEQADALYQLCQQEIVVLMNTMAILESEKAIMQAQRVEKLTFLAFIFVPISFFSSFCSMNVPELQNIPLWVWFTVSTVLFLASLGIFLFDAILEKWRLFWK